MQDIHSLIEEYGDSHQNRTNKLIHWICVPAIVWTVFALLWSIPFPGVSDIGGIPLNWAIVVLVLGQVYYFALSFRLGLGLLAYNLAMIWITVLVDQHVPMALWKVALIVFILAWIGQFIGHIFEGKKPSFFKDVQFLLIGPAWLMSFIYRSIGLRY